MKGKVGVVARREFLATVKRPSYLIATLGMPLFMLLIIGISIIPALIIAKKEARQKTVGIVDRSGALGLTQETVFSLPVPPQAEEIVRSQLGRAGGQTLSLVKAFEDAARVTLRPYATLETGQQALRQEAISSLFEFPEDYLATGNVRAFQREGLFGSGSSSPRDLLRRFVVERLLAGRIDEGLLERVRRPLNVTSMTLQKDGSFEPQNILNEVASLAVPLAFTILFFISVMMSSGFLLQGVSEEKESRVIEVILSSIDSDGLLLGKLIGLGGAGLLQIAIWVGLVLLPGAAAIAHLQVRPLSMLWSLVFYVLGYLLLGVLLTGTGSLGQNLKESQQYGMMWSLGSVVPMMSMMLLLSEPNGVYARVLSFIPLTAPVTMFLRLNSSEPPPWWEPPLAAAVLAVSVWLALKLMSRIFRVGLLLYGKRPTIPEILKLLRRPAA